MRISLSPQEFRELLLSHHPDLPCFKNDVFVVFDRRICAGCLLGYPAALLVLLLLKPSGFESIVLSLAFAILSQFRRLSENVTLHHLGRIIAGVALGFGLGGAWWALVNGAWFAMFLLITGAGIYLVLRIRSIKRGLEKEYHKNAGENSE
jgi:hypothetical protein